MIYASTTLLLSRVGMSWALGRGLTTTSRMAAGAGGSGRQRSSSSAASQPVFKKDLPPVPGPPLRGSVSNRTVTPMTVGGTRGEKEKEKEKGKGKRDGGKEGSIYASYRGLPYNTKLVFWACGASKFFPFPWLDFSIVDMKRPRHANKVLSFL